MKGISSLERNVLECIGRNNLSYFEIQSQTGLHENVCFNIIQTLIIRGILSTDGGRYKVSPNISPLMMEEINGQESKESECLELIEGVISQRPNRIFKLKKIAMDERDEKIFLAMLSNFESFLMDAHQKAEASVPLKERKVIFWGMAEVQQLMVQLVRGN